MQDLEESLAIALAQIEVERLRVKRLRTENVHLKTVLRNNGISPDDAVNVEAELAEDDDRNEAAAAEPVSSESSQDGTRKHIHDIDHDATIVAGGVEVRDRSEADVKAEASRRCLTGRMVLPACMCCCETLSGALNLRALRCVQHEILHTGIVHMRLPPTEKANVLPAG